MGPGGLGNLRFSTGNSLDSIVESIPEGMNRPGQRLVKGSKGKVLRKMLRKPVPRKIHKE